MVSNLRREDKASEAAQYDFFPVTSGPATPHRGLPSRRFARVAALLLRRSRDETNAPPRRYLLPMEYPRTKWTRRVPHPVLIGRAASLSQIPAADGVRRVCRGLQEAAGPPNLDRQADREGAGAPPCPAPSWFRCVGTSTRDETCPVSTGGGTRRVQSVRESLRGSLAAVANRISISGVPPSLNVLSGRCR
jgi:hypothetical protein